MKLLNLKTNVIGLFVFALGSQICIAQQGNIVINQDKKIITLLEAKKDIYKNDDDSGKYKLQIYSGNRTTAESTRHNYNSNFSEWKSTLEYEAPNFKVWIGNFETRLEGESALREIRTKFPNAFLFKPKK